MKVVATGGSAPTAPKAPAANPLRMATFNVENFFDTTDDKSIGDPVPTPAQYKVKLAKLALALKDQLGLPDVVGLEEVENEGVLRDLLAQPALKDAGYQLIVGDRNDRRGICVAMLYRKDRLDVTAVENPNPKMQLPDSANGQIDPTRLFPRPPLVVDFKLHGAAQAADGAAQLTVIANHFKSKLGGAKPEPRRQAQGEYVGGLVDARRAASPTTPVVVLGDLNATYEDGAFTKLEKRPDGTQRLFDMPRKLTDADRYTYNYRGHHDMLDHFLVTPDLQQAATGVHIAHFDTGSGSASKSNDPKVPDGVSDHDPIIVDFDLSRLPARR